MKTRKAEKEACPMTGRIDCHDHPSPTPTPWHIGLKPGPYVYGPQGEEIADCRGIILEDEDPGTPENKANAAFIVRAVNAHEALIQLARFIRDGGDIDIAQETAKKLLAQAEGK